MLPMTGKMTDESQNTDSGKALMKAGPGEGDSTDYERWKLFQIRGRNSHFYQGCQVLFIW